MLPTVKGPDAVFVPDTFAPPTGTRTSVSLAELLAAAGSVTPPGAVTVAVLVSNPLAAAEMAQLAVYVVLPPLGRFTTSLILPEPEAVQVPPPAPAHVQVQVSDAENVSATVAPVTLLGPALLALIV